jgi:type I restriction enzyme R subunit
MEMIVQAEKTLVFCATQNHALAVRDLINQNKTSKNPNYCVRVTANDGEIGDKHLRAFQDNEKTIPTILTTSQKLSTGVDARNVRNIILMRPVNSMIEFKQIIGRGTRLFDGKDYFTIYDFVKAHEHFNDPEWDGEPEPPGVAEGSSGEEEGEEGERRDRQPKERPEREPRPDRIKVKLADGKERTIQSMVSTSFWSADGRPMSSAQFLESLFGTLPEFFKDEHELRDIWGDPETRRSLLAKLEEKGFSRDPLLEMQRLIAAEKSDLFDVLAFVAFALPPVTRDDRASQAQIGIASLEAKKRAFVEFVLGQYVQQGVDELDTEKLPALLRLKYGNAISDALAELGSVAEVRKLFAEFQKYLYQEAA